MKTINLIAYSNSFIQNLCFEIPESLYTCNASAKKFLQTKLETNINWINVGFCAHLDQLPKKHSKKEIRNI